MNQPSPGPQFPDLGASVAAAETRARLLAELESLYPPSDHGSRRQAGDGTARLVIVVALIIVGVLYDVSRVLPGVWYYLILVGYGLPPWVKAAIERRDERRYDDTRAIQLNALAEHMRRLPDVQIVTRLAALAARNHDGRVTGVLETIQALTSGESIPDEPVQPDMSISAAPMRHTPVLSASVSKRGHHGDG